MRSIREGSRGQHAPEPGGRGSALRRVRYLLPSSRRRLLDHLVGEVERGRLFAAAALDIYEAETRLLPWRRFVPPPEATRRLFEAAARCE